LVDEKEREKKTTIWNGGVHQDGVKVGMGHERGIFKF
jgi:hypothetical protein